MRSAPSSKLDTYIPNELEISIEDFKEVYQDWVMYKTTNSFPVSGGFRDQPEELMEKIIYIDSIYEKICNQVEEQLKQIREENGR